jgi:hypothetical protein
VTLLHEVSAGGLGRTASKIEDGCFRRLEGDEAIEPSALDQPVPSIFRPSAGMSSK